MMKFSLLAFSTLLAACHPIAPQNPNPQPRLEVAGNPDHLHDSQNNTHSNERVRQDQVIVPERTTSSTVAIAKQQNRVPEHTWCGKDGWSSAAKDAALSIQMLKVPRSSVGATCPNPKQNCHSTIHEVKQVTVESFQIDPELITHAAYRACVAAKKCSPLVSIPPPPQAPNYQSMPSKYPDLACGGDPVFFASSQQAESYCRWRGGRLPTEAELRLAFEQKIVEPPIDAKLWVEGIYVPANLGVGEILQGYYVGNSRLAASWYDGYKVGGVNEDLGSATVGFRCVKQ